jgi:hypothetical protein
MFYILFEEGQELASIFKRLTCAGAWDRQHILECWRGGLLRSGVCAIQAAHKQSQSHVQ